MSLTVITLNAVKDFQSQQGNSVKLFVVDALLGSFFISFSRNNTSEGDQSET